MDRTSVVRGLLAVATAAVLSVPGPALAAGSAASATTPLQVSAITTACTAGSRACPIRITFAVGAYSAQARGRLTGIRSQQWFVLRARAGQTMIVIVKGRGATRGIVYFPNGRTSGQPGGRVFDGLLPVSGDYRIRVTESTMGQAWSGPVDVVVVVY